MSTTTSRDSYLVIGGCGFLGTYIVKALVESHKYHPAESIDDVIQGKGKGLVAVLHGPPGTGKTLTAEGISELLTTLGRIQAAFNPTLDIEGVILTMYDERTNLAQQGAFATRLERVFRSDPSAGDPCSGATLSIQYSVEPQDTYRSMPRPGTSHLTES